MLSLQNALEAWSACLGKGNVAADEASIERYSRTTLPDAPGPVVILKPSTTEETVKIIKIANENKIPVYPISGGKNWGYGDACPPEEGHAIIDFSRMNRIIEVNEKLAYAVVEPGVTQGQLYQYLQTNNLKLCMDCIGAGPDASIVGNTVDRGFGHTPYGDHFQNTCGMEVVLGDGTVLNTGFGHFENAKSSYVYKWAIGPYIDGLFSQSNLGIVTKMGLWLMPRPEKVTAFFFKVYNDEGIEEVVEALRPLRLNGTIRSLVHIANDLRAISSFRTYPWEEMKGKTPVSDDVRKKLRKFGMFGAWNVTGALYGSKAQVKLNRKELKKAAGKLAGITFVDDGTLRVMKFVAKVGRLFKRFPIVDELVNMVYSLEEVYKLMKGEPTNAFLYGTRWRMKNVTNEMSLDPLENNIGLMWISPILPATKEATKELLGLINPVFKKYTFDPMITLTMINERSMVCIANIAYDKNSDEEKKQAQTCYDELFGIIIKNGYAPYRTNVNSMKKLTGNRDTFWKFTDDIKNATDPNRIISRGRYGK